MDLFRQKGGLANKHLFFSGPFQLVFNLISFWNEQQFATTFIYFINTKHVGLSVDTAPENKQDAEAA